MFVDTNQLSELLPYYQSKLSKSYEANEIEQIFFLMAFFTFGLEKIEVRTQSILLSESELLFQRSIVNRLICGEPIQYILGKAEFYDLVLNVDHNVLVPRPETAELVDLILSTTVEENMRVIDIGTGSGCIPLAIKSKRPSWELTGVDVSENALEVARKNSKDLNFPVNWLLKNILIDSLVNQEPFDVIISNPPYVLESDKENMHENVINHEPSLALFVPNDNPLLFYSRISKIAKNALKTGGRLFFEIHENYGAEVLKTMQTENFNNCSIIKDLQGKDRFVTGELA